MPIYPISFQPLAKTPPKLLYQPIYFLNYTYLSNHYFNQSSFKTLTEWACEMHVFLTKQINHTIERIERRERRDQSSDRQRRDRERRQNQSHYRASPRRLAVLVPRSPWWFCHIVQSTKNFFLGGGEETIENLIKGIVLATMKFLSYSRLTINHNTSTPYYSVAELYLNP